MPANIRRVLYFALLALTAAAIVDQLRRPRRERTWQGSILGVPYDFRAPPAVRPPVDVYVSRKEERIFAPRSFGIGWRLNVYRVVELAVESRKKRGATDVTPQSLAVEEPVAR